MKVSTRVEYGLIALMDIVIYGENGESVSALEIAQRENISHKYLEHILFLLRQAGFIAAQKGMKGGYSLARPADEIVLSDVLNALDSTILSGLDDCGADSTLRSVIKVCFWEKINSNLNRYTEQLKLSEVVNQCRKNIPESWDMYVI